LLRECALCLLISLVALAAPIAARADSPPQPIPADGKCAVPADPNWTKQEQFVWLNACTGKEADFNNEPDYGGDLDPKSPAGLPENRILRSSFIEAILLNDKYRSVLTRLGVRITGARFTETVDLRNAELQHDLWLDRSLLEKGVDLQSAETSRRITFDGSKILGTFNAAGSQINKDLSMHQAEFSENINLINARIGRMFDLSGSTVTGMLNMVGANIGERVALNGSTIVGMLNMNGIRVDQTLLMKDKAQFKEINLIGAHIGGELNLNGSTVTDMLNMSGIRVEGNLFMIDKAQFKEINLVAAHIGGQLALNGSTVTDVLDMNQIHVDQALFMRDKAQFKKIILIAAHIGGMLDLSSSAVTGTLEGKYIDVEGTVFLGSGATFKDEVDLTSAKLGQDLELSDSAFSQNVDLTGTQIGGVIELQSTHWLGSATLNLNDAAVGGIDLSHNWPDKIYLNGLTYHNLSNLAGNFSREQAETWFGRQRYAPQPYEQLANVLQSNGLIADATAIRYAGKERERQTASGWHWAWLVLLNYSIGFGYHLEFAFYWAVGLVLLGWFVLYATGQRTKHEITLGLAYSFDLLLPLIQLRKKHYDIDLDPWPRRYFYAHKIIGVILTSFIVAGISGLTK
jgi:hypothetical protein